MKARSCLLLTLLFFVSLSLSLFPGELRGQETQRTGEFIYACNQGSATVSVIDANSLEVVDEVDLKALGFSAMAKPHHALMDPSGDYWYVTLIGENKVLKFNKANELMESAELEVPGLMAMNKKSGKLLVGRSMSAVNPPQSFGLIQPEGMKVEREEGLFFSRPHAITTIPGTDWMYIASLSSNQILSLNTETGESELTTLEGLNHVFVNFAVSPDGKTMVATGQLSGKLLVFDITEPGIPVLTESIPVNAQPWHPVWSPGGEYVYFANKEANSVSVVNMKTLKVEDVIEGEGLSQPHGAALSSDGKYLFVTSNNKNGGWKAEGVQSENPMGNVTVIDTGKREIVKVIKAGMNTTGIGGPIQ